ncbi:hypothetical protein HYU11_06580 [Candidatus Woesearchaeota archaeon]|nr:hypothetical protein [Candidatus Woesearchaeota archaeon]
MMPFHFSDPIVLISSIFFTVLTVAFCFLIYFKTREIYDLTKYEGIMYFRDAFLFFGISYAMRFFFGLLILSRFAFDFIIPRSVVTFFILPLGYFSTIAILSLILSSIWKKFDRRKLLFICHGAALLLSAVAFITRSHFTLLYLQSVLLVISVILIMHSDGKRLSQMKMVYVLVSLVWLVNLLLMGQRGSDVEVFFQILPPAVFCFIYYRVLKWVK